MLRVLVAGGGIGGLCAAVALRQRGHEVVVFERAPELRPVGAGLTIQINAMRALARLGLSEAVAEAGQVVHAAALRDASGAQLSRMSLDGPARRYGVPSVALHRAALQRVLLEAMGPLPLRLGVAVTGFVETSSEVRVSLSDGTTATGDLLIGADGIHSAVRAHLHGAAVPLYAGYTAWRGVCDNGGIQPPELTSESWGRGARFGLVPIGGGELYWFAVANAPPHGRDGADVKGELLARFGGWHSEVPAAIEATPKERIFRTDLSDRPVLTRWGQGRVTLLGDAAHPMTPNLGQGACMAIEDAVVLQRALGEVPGVAEGLRRYEGLRVRRTAKTVNLARRFGRMAQWSNPAAASVRDALMRLTPGSLAERQLRWLYDFDA